MSYIKKNWTLDTFKKGDAEFIGGLNHMEAGIEQGGGGGGKTWSTLNLSESDILTLARGGQIINKFTTEYDPTNFTNDYFLCKIDQTSDKSGGILYGNDSDTTSPEAFQKVYVNTEGITDILPYLVKSMTSTIMDAGFDHNYYQTLVLYAGCSAPTAGKDYILSGSGVVDGKNVIYVQDVSQQDWENEKVDFAVIEDLKAALTPSREVLHATTFGTAFVFSVNGTNTGTAFAYVAGDSQLACWDSATNKLIWADTTPGTFYPVTFDGTSGHGTLRWLANYTTIEGRPVATAMTAEQKATLLNTGITFDTGKYTAVAVEDTSMKLFAKCFGLGSKYLNRIFSFNEVFFVPSETHIEYIGRPVGYLIDTYSWYEDGVKHTEKNGEHVWVADVQGVPVSLIIPDRYDEQGVAHRNTYILEFDIDSVLSTEALYRHTFKIVPESSATYVQGEYKVNATFQAVNSQMGDSTIDYILYSDESYYYDGYSPDWVLPCSGKIGQVGADGQVATWFDIFRVKATYTDDPTKAENPGVRCLRFEYFDASNAIQDVIVVKPDNMYKYFGTDFRSLITTYKTSGSIRAAKATVKD